MLNIFFLLFYIVSSKFLSGSDLYIVLTIHFGILLVTNLTQKKILITPLVLYYAGVIVVNIANINLISLMGSSHQLKIYNYIIPKFIDDAALIWCISSTLFIIGYNLFPTAGFPSIAFEIKSKKFLRNMFILLFVLNLLKFVGFGFDRNQIGKIFSLLNSIGILFFARLWAKEEDKTYRLYTLALFFLETYISLLTSYLRFELILPTFYLFTGYFIGKGELKYVFSYRAFPLIAIILLYSSVFTSLSSNRSNFIDVFTQQDDNNDNTAVVEKPLDKQEGRGILERSANVAQITNVVNLVERNGFYNGRASAPVLTALIPRILWPDKPAIRIGTWFALEIGAAYKNDAGYINNSINMTVAGELYLDFGWIGVILGSLLFGAFIALLWNSTKFYASEYNLSGTIFGGYLIMLSIGSYADLQIVVTLLSTYIIFLIIKRGIKLI